MSFKDVMFRGTYEPKCTGDGDMKTQVDIQIKQLFAFPQKI